MVDRNVKILIAEDNALVMLSVATLLDDAGFITEGAPDGARAIERLSATDDPVDVLVTDIQMGAGPDGWMVAQHARTMRPHLPVIYMTGDTAPDMTRAVPGAPLLAKPVRRAQLIAALDSVLSHAAAARAEPTVHIR